MEEDLKKEESKLNFRLDLWVVILAAVLGAIIYWGMVSMTPSGSDSVVALVDGQKVTRAEFDTRIERLKPIYKAQGVDLGERNILTTQEPIILDSIINNLLVLQEASVKGIEAEQSEIDFYLKEVIGRFENREGFEKELVLSGLTEEEYRTFIAEQIVIEKYILEYVNEDDITVLKEEIEEAYEFFAMQMEDAPELDDELSFIIEESLREEKLSRVLVGVIEDLRRRAQIEIFI